MESKQIHCILSTYNYFILGVHGLLVLSTKHILFSQKSKTLETNY